MLFDYDYKFNLYDFRVLSYFIAIPIKTILLQIGFDQNEEEEFDPVIKTCDSVCYGKDPCVRICSRCPGHHLDSPNGCNKLLSSVMDTLVSQETSKLK